MENELVAYQWCLGTTIFVLIYVVGMHFKLKDEYSNSLTRNRVAQDTVETLKTNLLHLHQANNRATDEYIRLANYCAKLEGECREFSELKLDEIITINAAYSPLPILMEQIKLVRSLLTKHQAKLKSAMKGEA